MAASIFDLQNIKPDESMTANLLGEAYAFLNRLREFIQRQPGFFDEEWKFYNKKSGWILKLYLNKRNLLFVIPCEAYFRVSFTFGKMAVEAIMRREIPGFNKQELLDAREYAEGRTIQYAVRTAADCTNVISLLEIKIRH